MTVMMDEDAFKAATQRVIDAILDQEQTSWIAHFVKGYEEGKQE